MELLRAVKVGEIESNSIRKCRVCNEERMRLVRTVLTDTNRLIHMFECECGERIWEE